MRIDYIVHKGSFLNNFVSFKIYSVVFTIRTTRFNIEQFYVPPTQLYLCVLCGSQN